MTDRERYQRWYLANREMLSVRRRAYWLANKEQIKAKQQARRKRLENHYIVKKLSECLHISHAEARETLGLPPLRQYTRHL